MNDWMKVLECGVLSEMLVSTREEITADWQKLHNGELQFL